MHFILWRFINLLQCKFFFGAEFLFLIKLQSRDGYLVAPYYNLSIQHVALIKLIIHLPFQISIKLMAGQDWIRAGIGAGNNYGAMPLFKLSIRRLCEVVKDVENGDDFTFFRHAAARTSWLQLRSRSFNSPARQSDSVRLFVRIKGLNALTI